MTQAQNHSADTQPANAANVLVNGAKMIGETVLPGASLLLDGKFVNVLCTLLLVWVPVSLWDITDCP